MPERQCPTCGRKFDESKSSSLPFCCERCRLVDLGRWLDERNQLPGVPDPESFDETAEE